MTRVLVTGASGQDGSYLCERLVNEGNEVHALVRSGTDESEQTSSSQVVTHEGDLADADSLERVIAAAEPDLIVNLGGISSVAQSWDEPVLTAQVTGVAVGVLLESAWSVREHTGRDIRFVQASSSEIFGEATEFPQTEETPICPVTPYGAAKAFAHHLVRVYRTRGMFAASGILYNHESPRRPTTFVTRKITAGVARIALGLENSLLLGNLSARRDWGWAPDYVDALLRIARADDPDDYIVATGISHTVEEFVNEAFLAAGISDWRRFVKQDERFMRPTDAAEMCGDPRKLMRGLRWSPTVGFREMVQSMVEHDMNLLSDVHSTSSE